jgi:acyl-CoA thioesterase-1
MKTLIALVLCASLAACGGGSSAPVPASAPVAVAPPVDIPSPPVVQSTKLVVTSIDYEGDSTIANAYLPVSQNAASVLAVDLGGKITVENNGVPGSWLWASITGVGLTYTVPFATRLASDPSQLVIGNSAINDVTFETIEQYRAELIQWVGIVRAAGKTPVLEEPMPVCNPSFAALSQYVTEEDLVASQLNVPIVKQYTLIPQQVPTWQANMLPDCIHPNAALVAMKEVNVTNVVKSLLQ